MRNTLVGIASRDLGLFLSQARRLAAQFGVRSARIARDWSEAEILQEVRNESAYPPGVLIGTNANLFRNLAAKRDCWDLLKPRRPGVVVYTRADLEWFADHPPLPELGLETAVAVPDGGDWAGLYDRHAVLLGKYAEVYLDRWAAALDPSRGYLRKPSRFGLNPELVLRRHLAASGVPVRRVLPVSALRCCAGRDQCGHEPSRCAGPYRYAAELRAALGTAARLGAGWVWRSRVRRRLSPPCFPDASAAAESCADPEHEVFEDEAYLHARCCEPGVVGLVPPPASKTSAAAQDPEALPPCWPIAGSVQLCLDGEEAEGTAAHA